MLALRNYQVSMIEAIRTELRAARSRILAVAPTGSGKTALTAHMIANAVAKGKRCWFMVHRRELVRQSVETLQDSAGVDCGIIASGFDANSRHLAQVASIQTLMRRWEQYPLPDLIICDEAHHLCAHSWTELLRNILARKADIKVIGLTATPQRLDGRGLGEWFEVIVEGPSTAALIDDGYLAKYRMWGASLPDLTGVRTVAGDYAKGELNAAMSRTAVVGDALAEYRKHCDGKRALVFMWSIESSKGLIARFNDAGIPALHVDGETNSRIRDLAMADFRAGKIKVISNVDLFGEGLDIPAVEAGFLMRPTRSLQMYLQQVGRILRPSEGKDAALIFDHAGHAVNHGYPDDVRTWTLEGETKAPRGSRKTPIRTCPTCFAVVPIAQKSCKWCGLVFEIKPREVREQSGELEEIVRYREASTDMDHSREKRQEVREARTLTDLQRIGRARNYSPKWAFVQWKIRQKRRGPSGVAKQNDQSWRHENLSLLADSFRPRKAEEE